MFLQCYKLHVYLVNQIGFLCLQETVLCSTLFDLNGRLFLALKVNSEIYQLNGLSFTDLLYTSMFFSSFSEPDIL